jgi:hypothetical protein
MSIDTRDELKPTVIDEDLDAVPLVSPDQPQPDTDTVLPETGRATHSLRALGRKALGWGFTGVLVTAPFAAAAWAVEHGPATHVEIAGQDVAVRTKINQNTTRIDSSALILPLHYTVPIVHKNIGADIQFDINAINPSDKEDRAYLGEVWNDPKPAIDRIKRATLVHDVEWAVGTIGGVAAIEAGGLLWYRRYTNKHEQDSPTAVRDVRRALVGVALGGAVVANALGASVYAPNHNYTVVPTPALASGPLAGAEATGLLKDALPFTSVFDPDTSVSNEMAQNLERTLADRPDLVKGKNEVVFVLAEDLEDENDMARAIGITAKTVNADLITSMSDLTFAGKPIESYIIDTINYYSGNKPVVFAPGLHDTPYIVKTAEDRGWQIADGKTQDIDGVKVLFVPDPRISTVGDFGAGDILRNPNIDTQKSIDDAVNESCSTDTDLVVLHDHLLGSQIAKLGCQKVGVLDGRSYDYIGPQKVKRADGSIDYEYTGGSGGGHKSTKPDPGPLNHPASFSILKYNLETKIWSYARVTIDPDTQDKITPLISFDVPYAQFQKTHDTGLPAVTDTAASGENQLSGLDSRHQSSNGRHPKTLG